MKYGTLAGAASLVLAGLASGASAATVVDAQSIHITNALLEYLQVGEVVALDFGATNVALSSNGAVASAPNQYAATTGAANANDGALPFARSYFDSPSIYHSLTLGAGNYLDITFSGLKTLSSLAIYGRTDGRSDRDVYSVTILGASGNVLYNGTLNAANDGHFASVSFDRPVTDAVPEPTTWAMMIMGFGAAGSMIRRRRAVIA